MMLLERSQKRLPSSAAVAAGCTSARSIAVGASVPASVPPRHVRRDFGAEQRLQGADIRGDAGCDPLEEGLIQRGELDRPPHARPSLIPPLEWSVMSDA